HSVLLEQMECQNHLFPVRSDLLEQTGYRNLRLDLPIQVRLDLPAAADLSDLLDLPILVRLDLPAEADLSDLLDLLIQVRSDLPVAADLSVLLDLPVQVHLDLPAVVDLSVCPVLAYLVFQVSVEILFRFLSLKKRYPAD